MRWSEEPPDHPVVLEFAAFDETGTAEALPRGWNREWHRGSALRAAHSRTPRCWRRWWRRRSRMKRRSASGRLISCQGPPTELVGTGDLRPPRHSRLPIQRWTKFMESALLRASALQTQALSSSVSPCGWSSPTWLSRSSSGLCVALQDDQYGRDSRSSQWNEPTILRYRRCFTRRPLFRNYGSRWAWWIPQDVDRRWGSPVSPLWRRQMIAGLVTIIGLVLPDLPPRGGQVGARGDHAHGRAVNGRHVSIPAMQAGI